MKILIFIFIFSLNIFAQKVENQLQRSRVVPGKIYYQSLNYHNQLAGLSEEDEKFFALKDQSLRKGHELKRKKNRDLIISKYVKSDISQTWDELDRELFYRRLNFSKQDNVLKNYSFLNPKIINEIKKNIHE